jgi:ParB-like chromosome segregation protein Spo0J
MIKVLGKTNDMQFHRYCTLFPQADDRTISDMADDIAKNGLTEPIITYEGMILDGRNRYIACKQVGVTPTYKEYLGDEPLQYVISKNMHRRHLNESQRAILADQIYKMSQDGTGKKLTLAQAAEQTNVSQRTVQVAGKVNESASDRAKQAVVAGVATLNKVATSLSQAQKETGIKLNHKTSSDDKKKVHEAQDRILDENAPTPKPSKASLVAKEFNDDGPCNVSYITVDTNIH